MLSTPNASMASQRASIWRRGGSRSRSTKPSGTVEAEGEDYDRLWRDARELLGHVYARRIPRIFQAGTLLARGITVVMGEARCPWAGREAGLPLVPLAW